MDNGRYLGLAPSPDSPLMFGEVELVIDDERIRLRHATGYAVATLIDEPRDGLTEMSADEVMAEFKHSAEAEGVCGWRLSGTSIRLLLLPKDEDHFEMPRLIIRGLPHENRIKPGLAAALFVPEQWECGYHALHIAGFEKEVGLPVGVPRLALSGRPPTITTS